MKKCVNCGNKFKFFGKMLPKKFFIYGLIVDVDKKVRCVYCGHINIWELTWWLKPFELILIWMVFLLLFGVVSEIIPYGYMDEFHDRALAIISLFLFSIIFTHIIPFLLYSYRFIFSKHLKINGSE